MFTWQPEGKKIMKVKIIDCLTCKFNKKKLLRPSFASPGATVRPGTSSVRLSVYVSAGSSVLANIMIMKNIFFSHIFSIVGC